MSMIVPKAKFFQFPEDLHAAKLYGIIDLGSTVFKKDISHQVILLWEVPAFRMDHNDKDMPRVISKFYSFRISNKTALGKDLGSWEGKEYTSEELDNFDLQRFLSKPCRLFIEHDKVKDRDNVTAVKPPLPDQDTSAPETDLQFFYFGNMKSGEALPEFIPGWIAAILMKSLEWEELHPTPAGPMSSVVEGLKTDPTKEWESDDADEIPY